MSREENEEPFDFNAEPAVGSAPPSAGVTLHPVLRNRQNGADCAQVLFGEAGEVRVGADREKEFAANAIFT
jgi:hypothetical protein